MDAPVEERWARAKEVAVDGEMTPDDMIKSGRSCVALLPQVKCTGTEHLKQVLEEIEAKGGEGVMLRQPKSKYVASRTTTLLKVKTFYDAEAEVVGHNKGTESTRFGRFETLDIANTLLIYRASSTA